MKIAIVGAAKTKTLAPYGDPEWVIWGCSKKNINFPRYDLWFEIHDLEHLLKSYPEYMEWLKENKKTVMRDEYPEYGATKFPFWELVREFGPYFFTSSIAYMMAYAIKQNPKVIGLYGVEMSHKSEYHSQRHGCHHFIQVARDRGIEVIAPGSGILTPTPFYRY